MKYFFKRYSMLVIAQTACLALGLWLEQRFIFSLAPGGSGIEQKASEAIEPKSPMELPNGNAAQDPKNAAKQELPAAAVQAIALF